MYALPAPLPSDRGTPGALPQPGGPGREARVTGLRTGLRPACGPRREEAAAAFSSGGDVPVARCRRLQPFLPQLPELEHFPGAPRGGGEQFHCSLDAAGTGPEDLLPDSRIHLYRAADLDGVHRGLCPDVPGGGAAEYPGFGRICQ